MIFWQKKQNPLKSDEYEDIIKRIASMRADISDLQSGQKALNTDYHLLRRALNAKFGVFAKEEEKVAPKEEEKPQSLNTGSASVFSGMPYGIIPK